MVAPSDRVGKEREVKERDQKFDAHAHRNRVAFLRLNGELQRIESLFKEKAQDEFTAKLKDWVVGFRRALDPNKDVEREREIFVRSLFDRLAAPLLGGNPLLEDRDFEKVEHPILRHIVEWLNGRPVHVPAPNPERLAKRDVRVVAPAPPPPLMNNNLYDIFDMAQNPGELARRLANVDASVRELEAQMDEDAVEQRQAFQAAEDEIEAFAVLARAQNAGAMAQLEKEAKEYKEKAEQAQKEINDIDKQLKELDEANRRVQNGIDDVAKKQRELQQRMLELERKEKENKRRKWIYAAITIAVILVAWKAGVFEALGFTILPKSGGFMLNFAKGF